ncbi:L-asparagine transporter [Leifsonia sp. 98AMF]|uniref:APC family permease n=1 Tax=unclassified Leifsonia TaxID=2663824 RepID=UPI00087AEC9D|nr:MULTISPECIES: APC family permease [unclassified Leifsonia]SDH70179.1 L-asparagine transporter [Leifsonia sp. 197AMF]SDI69692.1 L-asparagine transporter [Leifsonia sp. 466MF]SDK21543.1 L-asparagine transporter [Leifsonia sp. 157MF]SDN72047.1 L-asparagine transporter [Leifsonia sp. 509MF]SEN36283.1 L-asparagine transporter [Leifsonia sp. 467MF]
MDDGAPSPKRMTVLQATYIGVGSMVGAGIFALLGAAGAVAGAAVWLSFLIAGIIAALQGYSFAKLGSRYPSGGGILTFLSKGFGEGHIAGIGAWLFFTAGSIVVAMIASSFGGYASSVVADGDPFWAKVAAILLILVMTCLNAVGAAAVARVQSVIVTIVLIILVVFAVVTIANWDPALLAPSGYPGWREIVSSVALTFFAFLGFGVITFTAKDLPDPARQLPKAIYLALFIATSVYVAVSLGVFGTLTADEVVKYGTTALAEAAKPTLGEAGYVLMVITALFSTTGAVNAGLYPSIGMTQHLASVGQFPPFFGRSFGRFAAGLLVMAALAILLVAFFNLNAIASIGSAVALLVFSSVSIAHLRIRRQTGASVVILIVGLVATLGTFVIFCTTTLVSEPATAWALVAIIVLAVLIDFVWKINGRRTAPTL